MKNEEIVKTLRRCDIKHCAGCPLLSKEGCIMALKDEAADLIEKLIDRCARYAEEIAVLQEREKWVPVTERLPEVWRNDETSELVNYMIYSPDFGVDIGNYHANAKKWLCMALPCTVTHWRPLPDGPEEVE